MPDVPLDTTPRGGICISCKNQPFALVYVATPTNKYIQYIRACTVSNQSWLAGSSASDHLQQQRRVWPAIALYDTFIRFYQKQKRGLIQYSYKKKPSIMRITNYFLISTFVLIRRFQQVYHLLYASRTDACTKVTSVSEGSREKAARSETINLTAIVGAPLMLARLAPERMRTDAAFRRLAGGGASESAASAPPSVEAEMQTYWERIILPWEINHSTIL